MENVRICADPPLQTPRSRLPVPVLFVSLAVVLGLAFAVCSAALGAGPSRGPGQAVSHVQTIRLIEAGGAGRNIDVKPPGQSIGDYFAFHSKLKTLSGRVIGRADAVSTRTGKGKATGYLHLVTLTLPHGQITTQNTELLTIQNGNGPEAITGGTRHFKNVGGQVDFVERGNRVIIFVRIIR